MPTGHRRLGVIARHSLTRYLALAALGFAVDLTLLALLHHYTPLPSAAAVAIAFWLTYALNFVLNRRLAFHAERGPIGRQLARFLPQVLIDFVLTLTAVLAFQALGAGLPVARILAAATNLTLNYVLYRWWTFRTASGIVRDSATQWTSTYDDRALIEDHHGGSNK